MNTINNLTLLVIRNMTNADSIYMSTMMEFYQYLIEYFCNYIELSTCEHHCKLQSVSIR